MAIKTYTDEERRLVADFSAAWESSQGYRPAAWQKFYAMRQMQKGISAAQTIAALVAMRIDMGAE